MIIADPITAIIVGMAATGGGLAATGTMLTGASAVTAAAVGGAGGYFVSKMLKGGKDKGGGMKIPAMPTQQAVAAQPTKTAAAQPQTSAQEEINKKQAASLLTKDWPMPVLGKKALLG